MAIYTDEIAQGSGISLFDAPTTIGEALGAAAEQSFATSITPLLVQEENLTIQEEGRKRYMRGYGLKVEEPETTKLTRDQALTRAKEEGFELDIPSDGIREGALNLLLDRRRAERERNLVMQNAPDGTAPAMLLTQFAAQAVDPINLASAFIPVIGEARYTAMLARAGSTAGRLGVRVGVGAVEGAVGAAILEPAVYTLSQRLQDDYDITDSMTNIAFGAALGGGLRGIGGAIADRMAAKTKTIDTTDLPPDVAKAIETPQAMDMPPEFRAEVYRDAIPEVRAEIERVATIAPEEIKTQIDDVAAQIDALPETVRARAAQLEAQGLSPEQAARPADDEIAPQRNQLEQRQAELKEAAQNPESVREKLAAIDRGEITPEIEARAQRIMASKVSEPVSFADKSDLLKQTLGAVMNDRDVDPRAFLELKSPDPVVRQNAINKIKTAPKRIQKQSYDASAAADMEIKSTPTDEMTYQSQQLAYDEATAREVADQTGYNLDKDAEVAEAKVFADQAEAYQNVYRANALCMLRG